ncbi:MAG: sigma-E processing peptidase SpoIIGA [Clostridia bacterium]|nr:sigma-E processing peptidase SpoIIGA [Clostridia bacterium]
MECVVLILKKKFLGLHKTNKRLVIASIIGGLSSLSILLDADNLLSLLITITTICLIALTAYGFKDKFLFLKTVVCLYFISFCLSGFLFLIWSFFNVPGLIVSGSTFYFDISPLILILSTVFCYLLIKFIFFILAKINKPSLFYKVTVSREKTVCNLTAKLDTGNSLVEPFTNIPVVVANFDTISALLTKNESLFFQNIKNNKNNCVLLNTLRVIPFNTISKSGTLFAFKADYIQINNIKKEAYIAICPNNEISGNFDVLINPDLL